MNATLLDVFKCHLKKCRVPDNSVIAPNKRKLGFWRGRKPSASVGSKSDTYSLRIELDDPSHAPALLQFLRQRNCIAYFLDDIETIEVIRPHAFGQQEAEEIASILKTWRSKHPEIGFTLKDG
jgi:hypothetical protein